MDGRQPGTAAFRPRTEAVGLAIAVSVAAAWAIPHFHLLRLGRRLDAPAPPALPAVVYGTGLAHMGASPGQQAVQAAPVAPITGMRCVAVVASQQTGRWTCTQGEPIGSAGA